MPLALELAAARVALLGPADLASRPDRTLRVLVGGARDASERQRPCATIDWSFGLLGDKERSAFTRMAVFAAGATVGAAETVAGASLERLSRPAFLGVSVDKHARECVAGAAGGPFMNRSCRTRSSLALRSSSAARIRWQPTSLTRRPSCFDS